MSDFFDSDFGDAKVTAIGKRRYASRLADRVLDATLALSPARRRAARSAGKAARWKVLIVGIVVPSRPDDIGRVTAALSRSRHDVTVSLVPMGNAGKFENIEAAITAAPQPLDHYDWLVMTDDDITVSPDFLDTYLGIADAADLSLSQPAHAFESYTTFALTRRRPGSLARVTKFVEIGPLNVIRADAFKDLIPFPPSRYCWGIDLVWSEMSRRNGWKMGVVDGVPVRHLRPVGATYDIPGAIAEGRALVRSYGITANRTDLLGPGETVAALL